MCQEVSDSTSQPLVSLEKFRKSLGRSATTTWRWTRRGWLHPVNIAGRPYLTGEDIKQFMERAASGEFACQARGAACIAAETRAAKDRGGAA